MPQPRRGWQGDLKLPTGSEARVYRPNGRTEWLGQGQRPRGDQLFADFSGQFLPNPDGTLESTFEAEVIGGTGRFRHASGSYDFHIVARPAAFGFVRNLTCAKRAGA